MWQIIAKRGDLIKHGFGMLLLVVLPQSLPVRPYHIVVAQRTCQAFINVRQQMQVAYVSLVKDERAERTSEVDAAGAMMLRLFRTLFQMTLHLKSVADKHHLLVLWN